MPTLNGFADFLAATDDTSLEKAQNLLIQGLKNTYLYDMLFEGRDIKKITGGGTKMVFRLIGDKQDSAGFYNPNEELSISTRDTITTAEVPWSFFKGSYTFTEETIALHDNSERAYVDLRDTYESTCMRDMIDKLEESLLGLPNYDVMEASTITPGTARESYSILSFITRDGEVPSSTNGGLASGSSTWTTLETVDVANKPFFKNKFKTYAAATPNDLSTGIISAFDDIKLQVGFKMPNAIKKWSDGGNMKKQYILTSREGVTMFKTALRSVNDRMDQFNDPGIAGPQFEGIPVMYIAELDNRGWTSGQPDYLFTNFKDIYPGFATNFFFKKKDIRGSMTQPNTNVFFKFLAYNVVCTRRETQGRVSAA